MKIYTKTGDSGTTSLLGGTRVEKFHIRIETYGTIDELISYIGLLRDKDIDGHAKKTLVTIQDKLMVCASVLASENKDQYRQQLPMIKQKDIEFLEGEIDSMEKGLKPLYSFIIPGGHEIVSICHIVRNICRRAERVAVRLSKESDIDSLILKYLNRLSDYLFVLSRKLSVDFKAVEVEWKP